AALRAEEAVVDGACAQAVEVLEEARTVVRADGTDEDRAAVAENLLGGILAWIGNDRPLPRTVDGENRAWPDGRAFGKPAPMTAPYAVTIQAAPAGHPTETSGADSRAWQRPPRFFLAVRKEALHFTAARGRHALRLFGRRPADGRAPSSRPDDAGGDDAPAERQADARRRRNAPRSHPPFAGAGRGQ